MKSSTTPPSLDQAWSRSFLIKILNSALNSGEHRYACQISLAWLGSYPGDLPVQLLRAKALIKDGEEKQALPILNQLIKLDPEYLDAQSILSKEKFSMDFVGEHQNKYPGDFEKTENPIPTNKSESWIWLKNLAETRAAVARGDRKSAEQIIQKVLEVTPLTALSGITHLFFLRSQSTTPPQSIQKLAEHYHKQWPECIQFSLILAEALMNGGESERAVALLHHAASHDITGQVASRLWGRDHPYKSLWPQQLSALVPHQIPAIIASELGWNLLPKPNSVINLEAASPNLVQNFSTSAESERSPSSLHSTLSDPREVKSPDDNLTVVNSKSSNTSTPETIKNIEDELADASHNKKQENSPNSEGRFPIYVIFTTQNGLIRKYGAETTNILDLSMRKLVSSIRNRMDWGALLLYADDPGSMAQYGLKPVPADDPWKLKLALADLDDALGKRGARIGAILIVGGPDVVPFHYLPNPTDDGDVNVPSDNPYATGDSNYFIPEWSVGRLPGGAGKDPGLLFSTLRSMVEHHTQTKSNPRNPVLAFWHWIIDFIDFKRSQTRFSFGYSAEAWIRASSSVYRPIGDPRTLVTSPPVEITEKQSLPISKLGYFNLHGVSDSAEWFGQKDPRNGETGPDYPTAIHPKEIVNGGRVPKVIFTEACFGANILNKSIEDALALKFLASGSKAIVGSTVVSYGSVTTPLNAADLLGKSFWKYFKAGYSAGESLRRAKIYLATEMDRRQGYLDGEDQKTLISFVLYGDPLAQEKDLRSWKSRKTFPARINPLKEIKTVCDRVDVPGTSEPIPKDVIANVKNIVEQYLPGMQDAQLTMSFEHAGCHCEGHTCPTAQLGAKSKYDNQPDRRVVTLSKQVIRAKHVHETFARLTFDSQGKVVKIAVSR